MRVDAPSQRLRRYATLRDVRNALGPSFPECPERTANDVRNGASLNHTCEIGARDVPRGTAQHLGLFITHEGEWLGYGVAFKKALNPLSAVAAAPGYPARDTGPRLPLSICHDARRDEARRSRRPPPAPKQTAPDVPRGTLRFVQAWQLQSRTKRRMPSRLS